MGANNADFKGRPPALTATEILKTHTLTDFAPGASEDITGRKPAKSKNKFISRRYDHLVDNNPSLLRSIIKNGVTEPVSVSWNNGSPALEDGHDRVIAAAHHRPHDLISVRYVD
jgi:hypothetical protein